jgi:CheY-like chemotaxis protein
MNQQTILCIDDSKDDVVLFQNAHRKAQATFQIQSVEDGQKAIDYISGLNDYSDRQRYPIPDLILLDLKMPRKNGFEVLSFLRRQTEASKNLKCLIFTSSQNESDIRRSYELGANWYIMKPVDYFDLVAVVKAVEQLLTSKNDEEVRKLPNYRPSPPNGTPKKTLL